MKPGKVFLIGAGPGDPGLITVKGLRCLSLADVIVYDHLVSPRLLTHVRAGAEVVYAGKEAGKHALKQEEISQLLVDKALEGKTVARLKGGDPFLFGRGGEEALLLAENDIPLEIVPGVTSAIAAPAYAGIRGEGAGPSTYQAGDAQVVLEVESDSEHPDRRVLLGLVLGRQAEGWTVDLWLQGELVAATQVDELGNFVLTGLADGRYELVLSDEETEIHIPDLDIGVGSNDD